MALDESAILRRAQRLSAPTRRALSSGLEKALMSTRYQENPNVAGMLTEKALSGYGAGLSSAVSAGEREALGIEQTEEQMRLERERINMQRDAYDDQGDAATIGGITQLGLLGMTGYDLYNRWGGAATTAIGSGGTAAVGAGTKAVAGATAGAYTPAITGLNLAEGGIGPNIGYGADYLLGPEAALTYGGESAGAGLGTAAGLATGFAVMASPLWGPLYGEVAGTVMEGVASVVGSAGDVMRDLFGSNPDSSDYFQHIQAYEKGNTVDQYGKKTMGNATPEEMKTLISGAKNFLYNGQSGVNDSLLKSYDYEFINKKMSYDEWKRLVMRDNPQRFGSTAGAH